MDRYPEHSKQAQIAKYSQAIGEFLEYYRGKGIELCEYYTHSEQWGPVRKGTVSMLAEYFQIDTKKLDEEGKQMLEDLRELQQRNNSFPVT